MENLPGPNHIQFLQCSTLVAKVMIADDHTYTASEIELARELVEFQWNPNVTDFLYVVAGIAHPGLEVSEAVGALMFRYDRR